jgi:DNA mismatch repair protein MutS
MATTNDTPLMQQWRDAKARHPDALVFFRVGDFYEMFCEDAEEGARLLGLTLTSRNNGGAADVPLAGIPVRARDDYLERLLRLGRRVAICEQVEDPAQAKGIVRREVVETITPGAVLADALLAERRNNFLLALRDADGDRVALAAADISTGELLCMCVAGDDLEAELARHEAAELLLPAEWLERPLEAGGRASRTHRPAWLFDPDLGRDELMRRFRVRGLEGFGFEPGDDAMIGAAGALVAYIAEVQPASLATLRPPRIERGGSVMALDEMTRRNLELVEPLRAEAGAVPAKTLLDVVDETRTAMGGRLLRRWLLRPLLELPAIWARHEAVAELLDDASRRRALRDALGTIRDLERLAAKAAAARATPRELVALGTSLTSVPAARAALVGATSPLLTETAAGIDTLEDVRALVDSALAADSPPAVSDGGVIRAGFDARLDELRDLHDNAQSIMASLQQRERERTGIASLKVGYNKVFGYFLEVTRANAPRVPQDYERRQTLANAERYVTPELKELEARILDAEERIGALEAQLFAEVRGRVAAEAARLQATAAGIAVADVLAGFAHLAERRGYVRPAMHSGYALEIVGGRHPVVEMMMPREEFIPNDVRLDETARVIVLTGPNMAGKSTLLRQVGLIQLLAQVGAFVPASSARLPVCDRIFTRVGASDNLVRGQSTFMVEMHETAAILHGATRASLVLLDEIGRGTATYDGVSIAWAVTEHLHEQAESKTIFATHYHELTQLGDLLPAVVNCNVAAKEVGDDIVFLHRVQHGGADRSYGIQVARLAGVPEAVVQRAKEILHDLEGTHSNGGSGLGRTGTHRPASTVPQQLSLFKTGGSPALARLRRLDIEHLTPIQALNVLAELRQMADNE